MATRKPLVFDGARRQQQIQSGDKLGGITGGGAAGEALTFDQIGSVVFGYVASTGTGNVVLAVSPVLTTPNIGSATATSITLASAAANFITLPSRGQYLNIASSTLSETIGGGALIVGNFLASAKVTSNTITKVGSTSVGQYFASRYDRGWWWGTNVGTGDAVGTEYADTVNARFWIGLAGNIHLGGTLAIPASATANLVHSHGAVSPVLGAATADCVSECGVDRVNTRHSAAGNRVLALQTERGSAIYVGDDAIDFAASTAIVSVGATDLLSLTSTAVSVAGSSSVTAGAGTGRAVAGGALKTNVTATGNVGTGEDTLHTYTLPASTLSADGQSVEFEYLMTFATGMASKRVRVYFGSTTIYDSTAMTQSGGAMRIQGRITRTGAATQVCTVTLSNVTASTFASVMTYTAATETLSGALTLKATGESAGMGTADNDVVQRSSVVNWIAAA